MFRKRLAQIAAVFGLLYVCLFTGRQNYVPARYSDGYFLLRTEEDFRWFITTEGEENPDINVRLATDIILNDPKDWETWADTPPDNRYPWIPFYNGHFDGNGHTLTGYNAAYPDTDTAIFETLGEDARITNLTLRNSVFAIPPEVWYQCRYEDGKGGTVMVNAAALCHINYGLIENCQVEAKVSGAYAGGIVGVNFGQIKDCRFRGTVEAGMVTEEATKGGTLMPPPDNCPVCAGGIAARVAKGGEIVNCENDGDVTSVQLAGGIAGVSRGAIEQCKNNGNIHIEQIGKDEPELLIGAGICAANGYRIKTCLNTGAVTVNQKSLSFCAPIYGVAYNRYLYHYGSADIDTSVRKGTITDSYYVKERVTQDYGQSGVNKISLSEQADFPDKFSWERQQQFGRHHIDFHDYYHEEDADDNDVIHLGFGPKEDLRYEVKPGDSLWSLSKRFYGNGRLYGNIKADNPELQEGVLLPGMEILIQHYDLAVHRKKDEEGFGLSYLPSGENGTTRFVTRKPIEWAYGRLESEEGAGLDMLWPKTGKDLHHFFIETGESCVFCRVDANPDGDFLDGHWEEAQARIREYAETCYGKNVRCFEWNRYDLDNGEHLYSYCFLAYRPEGNLVGSVAYRLCDNMLAEFIGLEPLRAYTYDGEDIGDIDMEYSHLLLHEVTDRVPYMAAVTDTGMKIEEARYNTDTFYGRENWPFPQLHNPFALALSYDRYAPRAAYKMPTGPQ